MDRKAPGSSPIPAPRLALRFRPTTLDIESRTVEAVATAGSPVRRFGDRPDGSWGEWTERLDMAGQVDLGRLERGAPFLADHIQSTATRLGTVEAAAIQGGRLVVKLRVRPGPEGDAFLADLDAGCPPGLSIGYAAKYSLEDAADPDRPAFLAVEWMPLEVSAVAVPADPMVGFRSHPAQGGSAMAETSTAAAADDTTTRSAETAEPTSGGGVAAELRRVKHIARFADLGRDFVEAHIAAGTRVERVSELAMDERARRDLASHTCSIRGGFSGDDPAVRHRARVEALAQRLGARPVADVPLAAEFRGQSVADMARAHLIENGLDARHLGTAEVVERALSRGFPGHGTSDFPGLLLGSGARVLQERHTMAAPALKAIARQRNARDFREQFLYRVGEYPRLLPLPEHAETEYGTTKEEGETHKLETFARIFALSRHALVNDDLGAFSDFLTMAGSAAAELEGRLLCGVLTSNPVMGDGLQLFHEDHRNIASPATLSVPSVSVARAMMRRQRGLDGQTVLNIRPSHVLVPATLETIGEQIVTAVTAAETSSVNPFAGRLEVISDGRLDDASEATWYIGSDQVPALGYSYLDGTAGPQLAIDEDFGTMATRMRVHFDFAAWAGDWRGIVRNIGTGG